MPLNLNHPVLRRKKTVKQCTGRDVSPDKFRHFSTPYVPWSHFNCPNFPHLPGERLPWTKSETTDEETNQTTTARAAAAAAFD